jgi:hypothetical protein
MAGRLLIYSFKSLGCLLSMQETSGRDKVPRSQKDQMHDGSKGTVLASSAV